MVLRLFHNEGTGLSGGPVALPAGDVTNSNQEDLDITKDDPRSGSGSPGLPAGADQHVAHYRVAAPPTPPQDRDVHLVLVVDVSGSMGSLVQAVSADGSRESNGFTLLDLVKHSLLTILAALGGDYAAINSAAAGSTNSTNTATVPEPDMEPPATMMLPTNTLNVGTGATHRYLSLVKFTTTATTVFEKLDMANPADRATALEKIHLLQPECSTNLWGGLNKGLEVCKNSLTSSVNTENVPCELLLFTDGLPNVSPARGSHVAAFQHFLKNVSADVGAKITLRTYGFGYSLDAKLLDELARVGRGTFAFIPDSGFVGTIFIHSLASILSVCDEASGQQLVVEIAKGQTTSASKFASSPVKDMVRIPALQLDRDYEITRPTREPIVRVLLPLRGLEYGQPRDFVFYLPPDLSKIQRAYLTSTKTFFLDSPTRSSAGNKILSERSAGLAPSTVGQALRQQLVELLQQLVDEKQRAFGVEGQFYANPTASKEDVADKEKRVQFLVEQFRRVQNPTASKEDVGSDEDRADETTVASSDTLSDQSPSECDEFFEALLTDLSGQVVEATSKPEYYNRWGATYLRSLLGAHRFQRRNNFKDPGVQLYNNFVLCNDDVVSSSRNDLCPCFFEKSVSAINEIFDNLTPPSPSGAVGASSHSYAPVSSMVSYNNR